MLQQSYFHVEDQTYSKLWYQNELPKWFHLLLLRKIDQMKLSQVYILVHKRLISLRMYGVANLDVTCMQNKLQSKMQH